VTTPTRAEVIAQLKTFICTELVRNADLDLADDEPIISGGIIDSFSLAHVAVFIENSFGVTIPDTELTVENMDTLEQMAQRVQERM